MADEKKREMSLGDILREAGWGREKSSTEKALDRINHANFKETETITLTPNGVQFLLHLLEKEEGGPFGRKGEAEAWDMGLIKSLKDKLKLLKQPE